MQIAHVSFVADFFFFPLAMRDGAGGAEARAGVVSAEGVNADR